MQFCQIKEFSPFFIPQALDFIAGYPATEGMQTYRVAEVYGNGIGFLIGRIRCMGYAIAHAISTPISPLIALVRVVTMPIFFGLLVICESKADKPFELIVECCGLWKSECTSVITSPLYGIAGTVRAASGIILPSLYLKATDDCEILEDSNATYIPLSGSESEEFIDDIVGY